MAMCTHRLVLIGNNKGNVVYSKIRMLLLRDNRLLNVEFATDKSVEFSVEDSSNSTQNVNVKLFNPCKTSFGIITT